MDEMILHPTPADIMIVDDTPLNLSLLTRILHRRGHEVRAFTHGAQALESACTHPPDLILLDIMMPEMDGYMVCERLKAAQHTQDVPVIFLSALGQTEDKLRGFQAGGVDYIVKPFQADEILARVDIQLNLQALRRQLQEANQILQARNQELQARNDELDAFAQTVAHDLKNPLGVILGYASMLVEYYPNMTETDRLNSGTSIVKASEKMMRIVDELLLLARVRNSQEVKLAPLNMAFIVRQALERLATPLQEAGVQVTSPESWPVAMGYAPWVEEVWVNYLSNSLKYGGQPPHIKLGGESRQDGMVRYWVSDNGPGLSQEEQSHLFLPFTRLQTGKASGHGLGLSIVRRIVEKLGGTVGVESLPGAGSKFFFTLPHFNV